MRAEGSIGQARQERLISRFRLGVNTIFKHFRSSIVEFPPIAEYPMPMSPIPAAQPDAQDHARRRLFRWVLFLLGGFLAVTAFVPLRAEESRTLVIPPNDGYGFDECLKAGSQCGLVVADAWCKAHGFGASKGFAPETEGTADAAPGSILVTCGDRVD
jgi:hypothetical protein